MSEETTTAPEEPTNVVEGNFGAAASPGPTEPVQEAPEQPLSGSGLPPEYVAALEKANTHHIFGEIKNHVANFGYTMLSGFKALEHIIMRDSAAHADASSAWDRVEAALDQAGANFEDEKAAIKAWFRASDPRPPILTQPQAPTDPVADPATDPVAEATTETPANESVVEPVAEPVSEAPAETPPVESAPEVPNIRLE